MRLGVDVKRDEADDPLIVVEPPRDLRPQRRAQHARRAPRAALPHCEIAPPNSPPVPFEPQAGGSKPGSIKKGGNEGAATGVMRA